MKTRITAVVTALSFAATVACFAANPQIGTWKLNEGKSKIAPGMGKSMTVIYSEQGDKIKVTVDGAVNLQSKNSFAGMARCDRRRHGSATRATAVSRIRWSPQNPLSKTERRLNSFDGGDSEHMTTKYLGVDGYVGNTPLIRLRRLSEMTGCEILGQAEFMNPGGSVKDRAAYGIITDAEQQGLLKPGATIVEGTAGNTGIGLALIGHARGYQIVIVIPKTQSPEKLSLLRTLGAEVIAVPEKPYRDPENYNHIARRLAEERGWFWANQFDNTANREAHYRSTGPEIWKQTSGQVSAFVASVGTGGTLAGGSLFP